MEKTRAVYKGLHYISTKGGYLTRRDAQRRIHYLHRVIWEEHYGKVPSGHVVHHIDHNKQNNAVENLQLMTKEAHLAHHMNELKTQTIVCRHCGIEQTFHSRSNKTRIFCTLRCNVAHWNLNKGRTINIEIRNTYCERCQSPFSTRVSYQRYCSARCSKAAQKKRRRIKLRNTKHDIIRT